jgi:hypothetical protein
VCLLCDSKQHAENKDTSGEVGGFSGFMGENFIMRTSKARETKYLAFRGALQRNSMRRSLARLIGYGILSVLFAASGASAQTVTATVAAGSGPSSVAVNPVTNTSKAP